MNEPEAKLLRQMPHIEAALARALAEAADEPMAFVLFVTPVGRKGTHIVTSNIDEPSTVVTFLLDAAKIVKGSWREARKLARDMAKRVVH